MMNLQKMGGIAALYEAATYVFSMVGYILVVGIVGVADPAKQVALMVDNQAIMYILNLFGYIVFGIVLVVVVLALYERLKPGSPAMMQIATAIGLIWACIVIASGMISNIGMENVVDLYGTDPVQAATGWLAIGSVTKGLGGGTEILGGLWVLLVSWAALRSGGLPKALNYLGVLISVPAIISIVPGLGELGVSFGGIFGLGQIAWFVWLGIVMLRNSPKAAA
jgi:hypothetical protein